mmetsp:Transcript_161275/g.294537  ORF Transcript_161275/g.294537 Transcript_161275/m.294537 type:complete len:102 (+) Transcript_161275:410-715(+)
MARTCARSSGVTPSGSLSHARGSLDNKFLSSKASTTDSSVVSSALSTPPPVCTILGDLGGDECPDHKRNLRGFVDGLFGDGDDMSGDAVTLETELLSDELG